MKAQHDREAISIGDIPEGKRQLLETHITSQIYSPGPSKLKALILRAQKRICESEVFKLLSRGMFHQTLEQGLIGIPYAIEQAMPVKGQSDIQTLATVIFDSRQFDLDDPENDKALREQALEKLSHITTDQLLFDENGHLRYELVCRNGSSFDPEKTTEQSFIKICLKDNQSLQISGRAANNGELRGQLLLRTLEDMAHKHHDRPITLENAIIQSPQNQILRKERVFKTLAGMFDNEPFEPMYNWKDHSPSQSVVGEVRRSLEQEIAQRSQEEQEELLGMTDHEIAIAIHDCSEKEVFRQVRLNLFDLDSLISTLTAYDSWLKTQDNPQEADNMVAHWWIWKDSQNAHRGGRIIPPQETIQRLETLKAGKEQSAYVSLSQEMLYHWNDRDMLEVKNLVAYNMMKVCSMTHEEFLPQHEQKVRWLQHWDKISDAYSEVIQKVPGICALVIEYSQKTTIEEWERLEGEDIAFMANNRDAFYAISRYQHALSKYQKSSLAPSSGMQEALDDARHALDRARAQFVHDNNKGILETTMENIHVTLMEKLKKERATQSFVTNLWQRLKKFVLESLGYVSSLKKVFKRQRKILRNLSLIGGAEKDSFLSISTDVIKPRAESDASTASLSDSSSETCGFDPIEVHNLPIHPTVTEGAVEKDRRENGPQKGHVAE